jgi:hypothetical protein
VHLALGDTNVRKGRNIDVPRRVTSVRKMPSLFFGRLIVVANNIDAIPNMPVRA